MMPGQYADLKQKHAFITGGGSGIGATMVEAFLEQGCQVTFVDNQTDAAESLLDRLTTEQARRCQFRPCDVTQVEQLQRLIAEAAELHNGLHILINNAASDSRHRLQELTPQQWDLLQSVNLRPHFFTAQAALPWLKQQGGSIINMGSNSALLGLTGYPAYVAAKSAIIGLSKTLARELGTDAIRVNSLIPGWVMTERQKKLWATQDAVNDCLKEQAIKSTISEQDVAAAALFLASDASRMISGQSLIVDGGRA
ncbi:SDR family NAD(P)-dependent oxidoreductase [Lacimicrobium alkaliphilum]|uniref:3-oxoacyl-ACP reductase n=1 Tax=Lacimicrobium alkaliphilum TaxID=1526571 RepID=A0ABQ1R8S3_9ALTE|nr:SDR family oxidoreductase [Lacimicrobium alkaliphilum]GGD60200.1 3-oxoacyl-ACP reductase [Lacimicrobium alkaliphilum]